MKKTIHFIPVAMVIFLLTIGQQSILFGQNYADYIKEMQKSEITQRTNSEAIVTPESKQQNNKSTTATINGLIGIDFGTPTQATPLNWKSITGSGTQTSLMTEAGDDTEVSVSVTGCTPASYAAQVNSSTIPTHSNSISNIYENIYAYDLGGGCSVEIKFTNLLANTEYDIWVFGIRDNPDYPTSTEVLDQDVSIQGDGAPTTFSQITSTNQALFVNDMLGSSSSDLSSYSKTITSSSAGEITITVTAGVGFIRPLYAVGGTAISGPFPYTPDVPVSGWALYLLIGLAGLFLFFRFIKR